MIFLPVDLTASLLAKAIGCPYDQAKVLVWVLIFVGCGYAYRSVNGALNRNLFGLVIGSLFCFSMYGARKLISNQKPCSSTLTYLQPTS